ncbi:molybdopterin molybdotransferase MoeA [Natronosporangium hydrolyticum]|uniref:Molybdopterin molybdenumtransferase n=2 Tax=Natronosporangium hydrolyticum TaxID=2811111 RepID=A0A895YTZ4_9ACTN|nr:molybdopterin molybdotransferase MoeA [Natronosporangium hydrolyticum]
MTAAWAAGRALTPAPVQAGLPAADGRVLAEPLVTQTDLPAFPTSSVDGWAVRGPGPWRITGQILAGSQAAPLTADGECAEIATGAMVPTGTTAIVRVEHATVGADGRVSGEPRERPEWRLPGEEAHAGEELFPAGTPVTPGLLGLAASCGYESLAVRPAPRAAVLIFGDELLSSGLPGDGRVRDALGPQLPGWLSRLGATVDRPVTEPGVDTLAAHVEAISEAFAAGADLVCTTGGTMHGPVDHLHPALAELGAEYIIGAVRVRPGFPMLLARVPLPGGGSGLLAGLPGNPQSAVVALVSLVAPALAGWAGRGDPAHQPAPRVRLGAPVPGRGGDTHLALVHRDPADGLAYPLPHAGSAMLRGLARAAGFAVIAPETSAAAGDEVPLLPLPLLPGEVG